MESKAKNDRMMVLSISFTVGELVIDLNLSQKDENRFHLLGRGVAQSYISVRFGFVQVFVVSTFWPEWVS